jgi:hypothetical protein
MSEWQPIETAPRDGTWIIVAGTSKVDPDYNVLFSEYGDDAVGMSIAKWDARQWRDQWDDYYGPDCPTHWMPLPEPPK